jgi:hypothetical protein
LKKLQKDEAALSKLSEIGPGPWWNLIAEDDWFRDPQPTEFRRKFEQLFESKINYIIEEWVFAVFKEEAVV